MRASGGLVGIAATVLLACACGTTSTALNTASPTPSLQQSPSPKLLDAKALIEVLKSKGVPIGEVQVYTADNDANKLLGRPHQYISKANWHDTRIDAANFDVNGGGAVETFSSATDLVARVKYVSAITQGAAIFAEYEYQSPSGLYFLRLSHVLTPTQANDYVNALKASYPDLALV